MLSGDLDFCDTLWTRYVETAKRAGHDMTREQAAGWGGFLMITEDKDRAAALMEEHKWFWDEWFIPFGQRMPNVLIGSADEIADRIGKAHDRLGFNELFLMFGQGHLEPEAIISKVAPRFSVKAADGTLV